MLFSKLMESLKRIKILSSYILHHDLKNLLKLLKFVNLVDSTQKLINLQRNTETRPEIENPDSKASKCLPLPVFLGLQVFLC